MLREPVKVGDVLCRVFYYPEKRSKEYEDVTVSRVGRKYIYIQREGSCHERRYTPDGLPNDDYSNKYGKRSELYQSEEEYLAIKRRRFVWRQLSNRISSVALPPSYLTSEDIENIYNVIFKGNIGEQIK